MKPICYQFAASGKCRFGNGCKFSHETGSSTTLPQNSKEGKKNTKKKKKKSKGKSRTAHHLSTDPLYEFFAQYDEFPYHRDEPSSQQFYRMCDFFGWDRNDPERQDAHEDFKTALVHQFNSIYGKDVHDLEPWRRLCLALDISPLPDNVKDAQKTIKHLFVNLVDLTDTSKTGEAVIKFDTLQELQDYTIESGRYFPKENAYAGGVLKYLLREILSSSGGTPVGTQARCRTRYY